MRLREVCGTFCFCSSDMWKLIEYAALVNKAFIDAGLLVDERQPLKVFSMSIAYVLFLY
jgi:hypothetical protein